MFLCGNGGKVLPNLLLVRGTLLSGGGFFCKHLKLVGGYDYHGQVDVLVVI